MHTNRYKGNLLWGREATIGLTPLQEKDEGGCGSSACPGIMCITTLHGDHHVRVREVLDQLPILKGFESNEQIGYGFSLLENSHTGVGSGN